MMRADAQPILHVLEVCVRVDTLSGFMFMCVARSGMRDGKSSWLSCNYVGVILLRKRAQVCCSHMRVPH